MTAEEKRQKRHDYYKLHRDEIRAKAIKYREANRAKICAQSVASAKRRHEKVAAYHREYNAKHGERQKQLKRETYRKNAAEYKARAMAYARANPGYRAAVARKRQAVKKQCPVGDLKAVAAFYRTVRTTTTVFCHWCKRPIPKGAERTVDHVIPIALGGAHAIDNLVPACRSCNCSKQKRTPSDFKSQRAGSGHTSQ